MAIETGTKFLGIASSVDTTERRSKRINDKSEYHTIEDIATHVSSTIAVDADTIVGQFDAENYTAIGNGLDTNQYPYAKTVVSIPSFTTSNTPTGTENVFTVLYTNDNAVAFGGPPKATWDNNLYWTLDFLGNFTGSYYVKCHVTYYGLGATNPPTLVTGLVDGNDTSKIAINVYDQSFAALIAQTTANHLTFGLQIEIARYA